jgi:hypothetical protein
VVTVIETYEGKFASSDGMESAAFPTGIQWEYSIVDSADNKVKRVTAYFDPGLNKPSSVQYTYRVIDTRANKSKLLSITDTYENNLLISTQKTWRDVETVTDPITGQTQGAKVVTSTERTWRHFDPVSGKVLTYTETYEGGIRTNIQKAYKDAYKGRLALIVETYEFNLTTPTSIQKVYYDTVDTKLDGNRVVKVIENWIQLGNTQYQQSMQYAYRRKDTVIVDPSTSKTEEKYVSVIETYEGDFTKTNGYFLTQVQKDYSVLKGGNVIRVSSYYDPGLLDTPTSIQFRSKRLATSYIETVIETYEAGILTSTQVIWKKVEDVINPLTTTSIGSKVVTYVRTEEFGLVVSEQKIWKDFEDTNEDGIKDTVITYTLTHTLNISEWTSLEKSY